MKEHVPADMKAAGVALQSCTVQAIKHYVLVYVHRGVLVYVHRGPWFGTQLQKGVLTWPKQSSCKTQLHRFLLTACVLLPWQSLPDLSPLLTN